MRGFTDKALILGPDPSACDGKPWEWKRRLSRSVDTIIRYCKGNCIDPYYLITDEMMFTCDAIFANQVNGIMTLGRGDMHFLATHNDAYIHYDICNKVDMFKDIVKDCMQNIAVPEDNKGEDARWSVILKRESKAARQIIKSFDLVFNIQYKNNAQYKAKTKVGDNRAVVSIDAKTFMCQTEMSGQQISPIDIIGIGNANLPVYQWEV